MKARDGTIVLLVIGALGWIGWDIYVAFGTSEPGDTISEILLLTAQYTSLLPAALGFLMGHLFWPKKDARFRLGGVLATASAFGVRDVAAYCWPVLAPSWWPITALLLAIPAGHVCWPQEQRSRAEMLERFQQGQSSPPKPEA